jgi:hypothetical protein
MHRNVSEMLTMNAFHSGLAALIFSLALSLSCRSANASSGHPWSGHGGRCPYKNCNLQSEPISGTNKQTCKQNGEGCLRPK